MIAFDVEASYERTYHYEGSQLVRGSVQDTELRRAYYVAMWNLLAWLQTLPQDQPDQDALEKLEDVAKQVETFCLLNTSSEERSRPS